MCLCVNVCMILCVCETKGSRQTRVHEKCINKRVKASGCEWEFLVCVCVCVCLGKGKGGRDREEDRGLVKKRQRI